MEAARFVPEIHLTCLRNQPQEKQTDELLAVTDVWLISILLQDSSGSEKFHLPDVQFGMVFIDLVTYINRFF